MRSWARARAAVLAFCALALASGAWAQKIQAQKAAAKRSNELTLAGLRPGVDRVARAKAKFGIKDMNQADGELTWKCGEWKLTLDLGERSAIRTILVTEDKAPSIPVDRANPRKDEELPIPCYLKISATTLELDRGKGWDIRNLWVTGKGLALADSSERVLSLYGQPDSRSPSTKEGQPLELWYYAFDWAGADVPQVMEVLCTKEADGKPGRVVEITLAGPSL